MLLPGRKVGYGSLAVEGVRIAAIKLYPNPPPEVLSASRLIMPGLVNCHGHTPMTLMRGLGSGLPLQRWLTEAIFPVEEKMTDDDALAGAAWGIMEMLSGGTTCVADMYEPGEGIGKLLVESGMRGRISTVGIRFIEGQMDRCISSCRSWNAQAACNGWNVCEDLCIHSEYLTDESFCRGLAKANEDLKRPLHFHCSETKREHEECIERHGKTPIAYLASTGILDHGGYAAHCVWCSDDDFRIMAEKGISLVHNPSSNMKLGSGIARIVRARELGVNVALGTDGCASNDNLDLFEEMHLASMIHKGIACDAEALSAWDVIEMATVNGARALGMSDVGELAVGKRADFCVVDLDRPHLIPALDLPNLVVNSMHASDVVMTVVDGRQVYAKGAANMGFAGWARATTAKGDLLASVRRLLLCDSLAKTVGSRGGCR